MKVIISEALNSEGDDCNNTEEKPHDFGASYTRMYSNLALESGRMLAIIFLLPNVINHRTSVSAAKSTGCILSCRFLALECPIAHTYVALPDWKSMESMLSLNKIQSVGQSGMDC